jgi:hypothetical protein
VALVERDRQWVAEIEADDAQGSSAKCNAALRARRVWCRRSQTQRSSPRCAGVVGMGAARWSVPRASGAVSTALPPLVRDWVPCGGTW